jgi:hypothetical protein
MPLLVTCPHCQGTVEILEINCAIFRHGVYKRTGRQVNPHAPKSECDAAAAQGLLDGCGKPFQLVSKPTATSVEYEAVACDYI